MTDAELIREVKSRLELMMGKTDYGVAEEVVKWMKHSAETARVTTELSTSGRVHTTHFVPGLP